MWVTCYSGGAGVGGPVTPPHVTLTPHLLNGYQSLGDQLHPLFGQKYLSERQTAGVTFIKPDNHTGTVAALQV